MFLTQLFSIVFKNISNVKLGRIDTSQNQLLGNDTAGFKRISFLLHDGLFVMAIHENSERGSLDACLITQDNCRNIKSCRFHFGSSLANLVESLEYFS